MKNSTTVNQSTYMKKLFFLFVILFSISLDAQNDDRFGRDNFMQAGAISVTVGGDFVVTGSFPAYITERVDQFVSRLFNEAKSEALARIKDNDPMLIENLEDDLDEISFRDITLKRVSGEELKLDLIKFRETGDFSQNPYLKNDDVIIFPPTDLETNFITVSGAVNNEGIFNFKEGDKLSDALFLARGINKAYENVEKAEISRLSYNGEQMEAIVVDINSDVELMRGDRIRVLANETQRKDFKVSVIGEVNMPGEIPITKEHSTLKEVIRKAGGFTKDADLNNAQILRGANVFKSLLFSEEIEQFLMMRMSTLIEEDSLYFRIDEKLRFLRGNANVDFTKLEDSDFGDTLLFVRDQDVIYVPSKVDLVYVYGQVNEPSYVKYENGRDYTYYLAQAGGLGETATEDVYLIKGKTRTWFSTDEMDEKKIMIEPGDYIWASKKPVRSFWYHVEQASRIATVLGAIATVVLLFIQAGK